MSAPTAVREARWLPARGADRVLLVLVGLDLLVLGWAYALVGHAPPFGDEQAYHNGGMALSNLLRDLGSLRSPDAAELSRNVVASGWFMPGMPLLLAPLYLVVPDADPGLVRAYLGVVTFAVFLLVVWRVRRVLGPLYAAAVLVMPGLVPMWAGFALSAWGDLMGGLLLCLLVVELVVLARRVRKGKAPSVPQGMRVGLIAIAVVYFRSSATLVVMGLGVVAVIAVVTLLRRRARIRALVSAAAAATVFVAVLAPWSFAASIALDGPVVTTTSVANVLGATFGESDRACYGPCDPGSSRWFAPLRYSRETAAVTGRSEMDVQAQMSAYARAEATPHSYAHDVLRNTADYLRDPPRFFRWLGADHTPTVGIARIATFALVWSGFAVGVALILSVIRRSRELQILGTLLTLALGALATQPFVHVAGPRYWTTAAPLLGLSAAVLWVWLAPAHRAASGSSPGEGAPRNWRADLFGPAGIIEPRRRPKKRREIDATFGRWLTRLQIVLAVGALAMVLLLVVLAAI